jgi:3-dehydroquinate synthetase
VAAGIALAFDLSAALGLCPTDDLRRVRRHLAACGLPVDPPRGAADPDRLLELMRQDKKARGGLTFILARGIGRAFVARDVAPDAVRAVLTRALAA